MLTVSFIKFCLELTFYGLQLMFALIIDGARLLWAALCGLGRLIGQAWEESRRMAEEAEEAEEWEAELDEWEEEEEEDEDEDFSRFSLNQEERRLQVLLDRKDRAEFLYKTSPEKWEQYQNGVTWRGLLYDIEATERKIRILKGE